MGTCCSTQRASAAAQSSPAAAAAGTSQQHVGPLTAQDLNGYTPKQDRNHLRLGLRKEGMLAFLEQIGFVQWTGEGEKQFDDGFGFDSQHPVYSHWNYNQHYTRDPDLAAWLDAQVGIVKVGNAVTRCPNGGLMNVTGYDLADYIRRWQRNQGLEQLSVCEIILTQPEFHHLRQYVCIANVFWSHFQMESFLGWASTYHDQRDKNEQSTLQMLNGVHSQFGDRLPPQDSCFFWLGYFCLRQCKSDFDVDCTIELIKDIGTIVSAMDMQFEYIKRSFCVLELYGALRGGSNLLCLTGWTKDALRRILASDRAEAGDYYGRYWVGPVDLAAAQTRCAEDKRMIDGFIQQLPGGFESVNRIVTDRMLDQ